MLTEHLPLLLRQIRDSAPEMEQWDYDEGEEIRGGRGDG
jgi:hypothetical protein